MGAYALAEPHFVRALAISEKANGPEHPNTATSLNNLAELYRAMGQYARAEPLNIRALAISEKARGPEHPSTGTYLRASLHRHAPRGYSSPKADWWKPNGCWNC